MMTSRLHVQEWNSSERDRCKAQDEEVDGRIHENWSNGEGSAVNRSKTCHGSLRSLQLHCSTMCCCSGGNQQVMDLYVLQVSEILGNGERLTTEPFCLYWPCCVRDNVADQDLMLYRKKRVILNQNRVSVAYGEKFHYFH
jgi:hypothetical protein